MTVEEIAAGITGKLREAMIAPTGHVAVSPETIHRLLVIGLYDATITPLGLAVRNHLISTPDMPKGDRE
ncbi:MAG TPA: hypothetical protein VF637_14020 [Sphingomicrobium sp.]